MTSVLIALAIVVFLFTPGVQRVVIGVAGSILALMSIGAMLLIVYVLVRLATNAY